MTARALLPLLLALVACQAVLGAEDVVTITGGQAELEALVKKSPFVAIEFYAPWCGHCKRLEPEWAKAATTLKSNDPTIILAKLDATEEGNADAKSRYRIGGYPTIKMFRGDPAHPLQYDGPREEDGIVRYLRKQVMPAYVQLDSAEAVQAAAKEADALVVGVFDATKGSAFDAFVEVADKLRNDVDFAVVTDAKLLPECSGGCKAPSLVMYKAGEEERPRYDGKFSASKLRDWVKQQAVPLVIQQDTPSGSKVLEKLGRTAPRLVVAADKATPELLKDLQALSKANKDVAVVLATERRALDDYGLKLDCNCKQELLIDDPEAGTKYLKSGASVADADDFIKHYQEGKLEPYVKSEEPPADNSGPVFVLTAKTFNSTVFKGNRDWFIDFYAPWCGHCQTLKPAYEAAGKKLQEAKDEGVVLAKFDCTTNDQPKHPNLVVHGYPTLYFVTAAGDVYMYDGDRSEQDFLKFIAYRRTTEPGPLSQKPSKPAAEKDEAAKEEL